ncbi:type II/IV secretion system ATPase subunit [Methanoregula sp.]|jgi:archaeal flagellar protein FlaI|uniref:type II/IV secretion system ATPase subunit n=1 Tax=Methanoregula sp. TaxID=2052170 RepID=UPI003C176EC8
MSKDTDDSLDDVNSLMKMIGSAKKKEASPKEQNDTPVTPAAPEPAGATDDTGDFSALMKKLGMANRQESASRADTVRPPDRSPPQQASPAESSEEQVQTFDDLLEDESPAEKPELPGKDVRSSLGKLLANMNTAQQASSSPPETPPAPLPAKAKPVPAQPEEDTIIEIIDEDPKAALRKPLFAKKARVVAAEEPPAAKETEIDEKIITVDQISDLSGLILPKGATFKIEELKLHGRINAFEGARGSALPAEFAEIWKKEFSTAGFKDLDMEEEMASEKAKLKPAPKKFGLATLFNAIHAEEVNYDPKTHGPLVDLVFNAKPGIEEMEMYPVNEPYAYIRIIYDHSTHEYTYQILEPILTEPEKELLKELKDRLFETLDINTKDMSREDARQKLRAATNDILADYGFKLDPAQKEKLHYNMHKDFLGNGLIDPIMHDKYIEDISCDGVNTPLFAFHSSYESMKTSIAYHHAEELDSFVTKLAQRAGKYISIAEPILDATMQDGSRIQMTLGTEVTAHGSTFTIRKFKDEPITPTDLIEWHTFSPLAIAYIWLAVENGKSSIFAGGTASGKTTALNAISLFIPPMAKIVSLEDTREVKLPHPNWIPSVTRDSFDTAGRGEINMYELLRAAMRQRPEYIIVGEVRGKECQTLFQAMSTGHVTYSTTHADSVASVVHRIENPPMDVPRNMLSALDFICIQVQARVGGKRIRRNKQIVEILDIDPRTNELITNEVFKWRSATDEHTYSGKSYLLEEIMEAKGWSENRMREELKRRQEVLEWMRIKKIRHYKDVAKILISYHRDPESVIEKVRKDLYE